MLKNKVIKTIYSYYLLPVLIFSLGGTYAFSANYDAESRHNAFVGELHSSSTQDGMCKVMETFYHPDNIRLSVANEHYNYIVDLIYSVSSNYTKTVKNNKYRNLEELDKFRVFCSNRKSQLFSRKWIKNFVKANRIASQDGELTTLEGALPHRDNLRIFYLWRKSGHNWYFYYASTNKMLFKKINEGTKQNIIKIMSAHYRIDYMFDRCLGFKNQIFNSDHISLLLQQVYGTNLKQFIVVNKKDIEAARKLERQKVDHAVKMPNSCDSEKARDQVVIALLNAVGRNIKTVSMSATRN